MEGDSRDKRRTDSIDVRKISGLQRARVQQPTRRRNTSKHRIGGKKTWGAEISVAHRKIIARYKYNHVHDTESISKILRVLATSDAVRDRRKAKASGELADMVSQEITKLQHMVQQQTAPSPYQSESYEESAHAATTSESDGPAPRRGRRNQKEKERGHSRRYTYPSTSRSLSPPQE